MLGRVVEPVPLYGLGGPEEQSSPNAAGKMTTDDESWFAVVARLAEAASVIFCVPYPSSGVERELALLLDEMRLGRTVFLQPPIFWEPRDPPRE